ncbi:glycogen synthase GlgA [Roseicyclus persicicus]|uniref:Glycogen synthase n=1 Tax=Roseicyclus persicicus TaxID=2650661 RepID=A0A7X6GWM8_9RHOB|nr:glycogen synthase GlgA [Roseibacterium persicicum]NKX43776.1 glycogen synthase GlgA [Roseibacterium persicicum]
MIRVLSVTSECAPLVKTGGLADVAGALPGALAPLGVEMRTLLPGYPRVMAAVGRGKAVLEDPDLFGGPARVIAARAGGLDLLVLDAPHLFGREGAPYNGPDGRDWPDNPERFAALGWVAAEIAGGALTDWQPQVLHCHDWQAGLAPWYLRDRHPQAPVGSVLTIHNIAFQGLAPGDRLARLRLPPDGMTPGGFEYWGNISALKAGLVAADRITTVSPTYADELLTPEFGMGMEGVLRARQDVLSGILNGVDLDAWTPSYKTPAGKRRYTARLRAAMGLPAADGPLCVVVSRLTHQKGLDLLLEALPRLLDEGGQLALLGSGEPGLEAAFRTAAARHPGVAVTFGYDEALARLLIEGGDAILVPSRFEPCGLTQLYGLRFGTLPLVAYTGGLADTVIDASPAGLRAGVATGVQFHPVSAAALSRAFDRLCALYRQPDLWLRMQRNAMRHPVGWDQSAAEYAALYDGLIRT